jgi:hypothetical protein
VANLLAQQGAAQAGGQLAGAAPFANLLGLPLQMAGMNYGRTGQFGLPGFKGFGEFGSSFKNFFNSPFSLDEGSVIPMQQSGLL